MGQKLPRRGQIGMSALPPKAAAAVADQSVRFGPKADIPKSGSLAVILGRKLDY
jgi:hypothetical protein